ncbi:hypothetical protein BaRGS_00033650 [Batillaria attramentaria]|uniref:Uncharacterized protein n=1 Tax=Batillaria attramentaria TaxID=370345 RepID=A0ABD0JK12_9CAEN
MLREFHYNPLNGEFLINMLITVSLHKLEVIAMDCTWGPVFSGTQRGDNSGRFNGFRRLSQWTWTRVPKTLKKASILD